jgi:hypothetical protein
MKSLLIAYNPGARGDFLAAILLDRPRQVFAESQVQIDGLDQMVDPEFIRFRFKTGPDYYKVHSARGLSRVPLDQCCSIRIRIRTSCENEIAYDLYHTKRATDAPEIGPRQIEDRWIVDPFAGIDFDASIDFRDLFCINSIRDLYAFVRGQSLAEDRISTIQQNFQLQLNHLPDQQRRWMCDRI